jgi:hypothetical protein
MANAHFLQSLGELDAAAIDPRFHRTLWHSQDFLNFSIFESLQISQDHRFPNSGDTLASAL